MSVTLRHIGDHPTAEMYQAKGEIDCQCARCGSSCGFVHCHECDSGLIEEDVGDDVVQEIDIGTCPWCDGRGGWNACGSSAKWCEDNPLPGRQSIPRGKIEWFVLEDKGRDGE